MVSCSERLPEVVESVRRLGADHVVLDGELVVVDEAGQSDFDATWFVRRRRTATIARYAKREALTHGPEITNNGGGGNRTRVRKPSTPRPYVRSP